jgi:hypothetical protein
MKESQKKTDIASFFLCF